MSRIRIVLDRVEQGGCKTAFVNVGSFIQKPINFLNITGLGCSTEWSGHHRRNIDPSKERHKASQPIG